MDGGQHLGVLGVLQRAAQRRLRFRELPHFRQHRSEGDIAVHIAGLDPQELAVGVQRLLLLPQLALRPPQSEIRIGEVRLLADGRLPGGHGLVQLLQPRQRAAMKKSKTGLGRMDRTGPFEQRRGLGKASLLQPDGAHQRHQLVTQSASQQWPHGLVGAREVAGLQ